MIYKIVGGMKEHREFIAGALRDEYISNRCGCTIIRDEDGADRKIQIEKLLNGVEFTREQKLVSGEVVPVEIATLPWKPYPTLIVLAPFPDMLLKEIDVACPGVIDFLGDKLTLSLEE